VGVHKKLGGRPERHASSTGRASSTPRSFGLTKWIQNHVISAPGEPACDGVGELWFESNQAMQSALNSPAQREPETSGEGAGGGIFWIKTNSKLCPKRNTLVCSATKNSISDSAALTQPPRITIPELWCFSISRKFLSPEGHWPYCQRPFSMPLELRKESPCLASSHLVAIAAAYVSLSAEEVTDVRIFLTCVGLAGGLVMLIIFLAEKQQEAALERLSSYKLNPQPAAYDEPDLRQVTARSPYMRSE
jgi:hypothetical protein